MSAEGRNLLDELVQYMLTIVVNVTGDAPRRDDFDRAISKALRRYDVEYDVDMMAAIIEAGARTLGAKNIRETARDVIHEAYSGRYGQHGRYMLAGMLAHLREGLR